MDKLVETGMKDHSCKYPDPKLEKKAFIKYGDDEMGDVKIKKGREA